MAWEQSAAEYIRDQIDNIVDIDLIRRVCDCERACRYWQALKISLSKALLNYGEQGGGPPPNM